MKISRDQARREPRRPERASPGLRGGPGRRAISLDFQQLIVSNLPISTLRTHWTISEIVQPITSFPNGPNGPHLRTMPGPLWVRPSNLVRSFISKNSMQHVSLIGHSFGAAVALLTAIELLAEGPKRVASPALIDCLVFPNSLPLWLRIGARTRRLGVPRGLSWVSPGLRTQKGLLV